MYLCGRGFIPTHNTSISPREGYEARALFQLRLYGLILWRMRGVVPRQLRLVYLGNSETVAEEPDEAMLLATQRKVLAIWDAIRLARETGEFEPSPGRQCDWCPHHALCPVFGGVTPPMPVRPPSTGWRARLRRLRRRLRALWKGSAGRARRPLK
jgi:putative RecB family exonuclease